MCEPQQPHLALKRVIGIEYPWFARMAVLEGDVELIATISTEGTVTRVRIISGVEPLAIPAKATLSRWQFTGCTSEQGECEVRFVVSFVLNGSCVSENCPSTFEVDFPGKIIVTSQRIGHLMTHTTKNQNPFQ
jgi:TonB family protein